MLLQNFRARFCKLESRYAAQKTALHMSSSSIRSTPDIVLAIFDTGHAAKAAEPVCRGVSTANIRQEAQVWHLSGPGQTPKVRRSCSQQDDTLDFTWRNPDALLQCVQHFSCTMFVYSKSVYSKLPPWLILFEYATCLAKNHPGKPATHLQKI